MTIRQCPSCGSDKIKSLRKRWSGEFAGKEYSVSDLKFHECPNCGERVFDRQAMQKLESQSPAFSGSRGLKRPA